MNIIVDLEHTISNAWHRIDKKNTTGMIKKKFQLDFVNDRPNENVITFMLQLEMTGNRVIILSAKEFKYKQDVLNWLILHKVVYSQLELMPDGMGIVKTAEDFKEEFVKNYKHKIDFALDDVGKNCAMFYKNNIPCLRIVQ